MTEYSDDALLLDNETSSEDIVRFLERRLRNPYVINDKVVWDFSNHEVNEVALRRDVSKMRHTSFIIPYSIKAVFAQMFAVMPPIVKRAEVLTYHRGEEEYRAYHNFYRDLQNDVSMNQINAAYQDGIDDIR